VDARLEEIGVSDSEYKPRKKRGRPEERWHEPARKIAPLIDAAMKNVEYKGDLTETSVESVQARVGSAIIRHLFKNETKADGFAAAMRRGDRSSLEWRFPGLRRLKVVADE
jgi:hypothetical protein